MNFLTVIYRHKAIQNIKIAFLAYRKFINLFFVGVFKINQSTISYLIMKRFQPSSLLYILLILFLWGCASTPKIQDTDTRPSLTVFNFSESDIDIYQDETYVISVKKGSGQAMNLSDESVAKYTVSHKREDPSYSDAVAANDLIETLRGDLIDNTKQNLWLVFPIDQSSPRKELCQVNYEYLNVDDNLGIFANLHIDLKTIGGTIWKTDKRNSVNLIVPQVENLEVTHIYSYKKELENSEEELGSTTEVLNPSNGKTFSIPDFWESSLAKLLSVKEINKSDEELSIRLLDVPSESRDEHLMYFLNRINGDLQLLPCTSRDLYIPIWNQSATLKYALIKNLSGNEIPKDIENPSKYFSDEETSKEVISWEVDEVACDEVIHIEGAQRGYGDASDASENPYILKVPAAGGTAKTNAPYFEWENPYYTADEGVTYTLLLSQNSDMSDPQIFTSSIPNLTLESPLEQDKKYYWKISDDLGGESETQSFETVVAKANVPMVSQIVTDRSIDFKKMTDAQTSKNGDIYTSGYAVEEHGDSQSQRLPTAQMTATKYSPQQKELWSKNIRGSSDVYGRSVAIDTQGNTYICGYFWGEISLEDNTVKSSGGSDIILAKISNEGDLLWMKSWGGSQNDIASSIDQQGGFLYISGYFRNSISYGSGSIDSKGSTDAFVAKVSSETGEVTWMKSFGDKYMDDISAIVPSQDESTLYITGMITHAPDGEQYKKNFFVSSLSAASGAINWITKSYSMGFAESSDITLDAIGNIYLATTFTESLPFDDDRKTRIEGENKESLLAIKFTPEGEVSAWKKIHTTGGGESKKILLSSKGQIILAGTFRQGIGTKEGQNITSIGGSDIFIASLDPDLSLSQLKAYGGEGNESLSSLSVLRGTENYLLMLGKSNSVGLKWSEESEFEEVDGDQVSYGIPFRVIFEIN